LSPFERLALDFSLYTDVDSLLQAVGMSGMPGRDERDSVQRRSALSTYRIRRVGCHIRRQRTYRQSKSSSSKQYNIARLDTPVIILQKVSLRFERACLAYQCQDPSCHLLYQALRSMSMSFCRCAYKTLWITTPSRPTQEPNQSGRSRCPSREHSSERTACSMISIYTVKLTKAT
jgi:hypothetical protein